MSAKEKVGQSEGLCLMWYQCEKCSKRERLWNSRPRVTPFMVNCVACDGLMQHVDWQSDEYAPQHQLKPGDRYFADWSKEAAEKHHNKIIEENWDHPEYPISKMYDTKELAVVGFMRQWKFGEPCVEVMH